MLYLLLASILWAPSFGLIKGQLAGQLDSNLVACIRLALSLLLFVPLLRPRAIRASVALRLIAIGAIQYGVMYVLYIHAYAFLRAYEVALLTIFTPLYVTLLNDLLERRFERLFLLTAGLAVVGSAIIKYSELASQTLLIGAALMQLSNLCFAFGQVAYRRVMAGVPDVPDRKVFGWLYLGAVVAAAVPALWTVELRSVQLSGAQVATLLHLGLLASGVAFFLWNLGARRVDAGALAVFNNLKIPLAVAVTLLVFSEWQQVEGAEVVRLLVGGAVIVGALWVNERMVRRRLRARPQP